VELVSKGALLDTLLHVNQRVTDWFTALPAADFFARSGDAWSAYANLNHLIKAVKPTTGTLKLPGWVLHAM
jgi:hypothetical protein